jgi:hypothetical protein
MRKVISAGECRQLAGSGGTHFPEAESIFLALIRIKQGDIRLPFP